MATVRSVLQGALRKLGVIGGTGRRSATTHELADSLVILVSVYRSMITSGAFGRMRDVVPRGDYVAGENQRVFRRYNEQQEILLPDLVSLCGTCGYCGSFEEPVAVDPLVASTDYGSRLYRVHQTSDRRTIRDGAVVTMVDEFTGDVLEAIYDGQQKSWFTISDLDLNEEIDEANQWSMQRLNDALDQPAPLSHRDLNGLTCLLATYLADDFAAEVSAMVQLQAQHFRQGLVGNYSTFKADDEVGNSGIVHSTPRSGLVSTPTSMPVVAQKVEGLLLINRAGTTPVSVAGTNETDLRIVVQNAFSLDAVSGILYFTASHAAQLGNMRHQWVLKDISSDQVLDTGAIEATGFAL